MGAQIGRPWCTKAGMYLFTNPEQRKPDKQCEACRNLIYVGCPDFAGNIKFAWRRTEDYVRWMRGEPIANDSPLFDNPKSTKAIKPLCAPDPDCLSCNSDIDCGGNQLKNISSNQGIIGEDE